MSKVVDQCFHEPQSSYATLSLPQTHLSGDLIKVSPKVDVVARVAPQAALLLVPFVECESR